MKAYRFDKETKEYIGEQNCQIDPIESKKRKTQVWLLPANSTYKIPLSKQKGKAIVFEYNEWIYKNDYRGKKAYNATEIFNINYIGDLKEGDYLLTQEQIKGLENGTLIYQNGHIISKPEPTLKEKVIELECRYQMNRWQREAILVQESLYSDYTKNKAQEIEVLAQKLRSQAVK